MNQCLSVGVGPLLCELQQVHLWLARKQNCERNIHRSHCVLASDVSSWCERP